MKRFAVCLLTALSFAVAALGVAQLDSTEGTFDEFERNMFFVLRIADRECPEALENPEAICYVHGYTDFFDFEDRFRLLAVDQLEELSRWRREELRAGDETSEVFRASYRSRGDDETFTLVYTQGGLLILTRETAR